MPRNSSGTMSATNGPYTSGTTISSVQVNSRFGDIENEISDSASRSGKGGFTAPVRAADGTVAAPSHAFTSEPGSGVYRAGAGDVRVAVGGVDALKLAAGGVNGPLALNAGTTSVQVTVSGGFLLLQGNRVAADITLADVIADSSVTRTAGNLFGVRNNGTLQLQVDYQGLLRLLNTAAIQPASIWTAITPIAGWGAVLGLARWKDACGMVHVKGGVQNNTGGGVSGVSVIAAGGLAAGFRPLLGTQRRFVCGGSINPQYEVLVNDDGSLFIVGLVPNAEVVYFDSIHFLAEA